MFMQPAHLQPTSCTNPTGLLLSVVFFGKKVTKPHHISKVGGVFTPQEKKHSELDELVSLVGNNTTTLLVIFFPATSLFVRPSKYFKQELDEDLAMSQPSLSSGCYQRRFCKALDFEPAAKCFDTKVIKSSNWYWAARLSKSASSSCFTLKCPVYM